MDIGLVLFEINLVNTQNMFISEISPVLRPETR